MSTAPPISRLCTAFWHQYTLIPSNHFDYVCLSPCYCYTLLVPPGADPGGFQIMGRCKLGFPVPFHSFPFFSISYPFSALPPLLPFPPSSPTNFSGSPFPIQLGALGSALSSPKWVRVGLGRQTVSGAFWVEKHCFPIALLVLICTSLGGSAPHYISYTDYTEFAILMFHRQSDGRHTSASVSFISIDNELYYRPTSVSRDPADFRNHFCSRAVRDDNDSADGRAGRFDSHLRFKRSSVYVCTLIIGFSSWFSCGRLN